MRSTASPEMERRNGGALSSSRPNGGTMLLVELVRKAARGQAPSLPCADRLGALPPPERLAPRSARDRGLDRGLRDVLGGSALRRRDVLALDPGSTGPRESLEGRLPVGSRLRRARPWGRAGDLPRLGTRAALRCASAADRSARPGLERTVVSERPRDSGV